MKHVGYMVMMTEGPFFFGLNDLLEARQYCEDGAEPVKLMADDAELAVHEKAQGEIDA